MFGTVSDEVTSYSSLFVLFGDYERMQAMTGGLVAAVNCWPVL